MKTLKLSVSDISKGNLILVNHAHPLKEDIEMGALSAVRGGTSAILLEKQTVKMLSMAMSSPGCRGQITPVSGYRDRLEQQSIWEDSLRAYGEDFTRRYVAVPGCSEHQTGLAADLSESGENIDFIRPNFPYTGVCGAFRTAAVQYGFIERYPAGGEEITRIAHEPWHFRYVGYPHSEIMIEKMLTLEEYTDYLKKFRYSGERLGARYNGRDFEIFHVPVPCDGEILVQIPDGTPYQVSGNNEDGVIVTLWRIES